MLSTLPKVEIVPPSRGARMVVMAPGVVEDAAFFARQVYALAAVTERTRICLVLNTRDAGALTAVRQAATAIALLRSGSLEADTLQVRADDWNDILRQVVQPGDLVIWPEERWLASTNIGLERGITQQVLPGVYANAEDRGTPWYQTALFWLSGLLILLAFAYLEFNLKHLFTGATAKLVLMAVFLLEAVVIYFWNRLFY